MSSRIAVLLGWALGAASFAYVLALPPVLNAADESFLLYGAKRILQGQALYHDFFDFIAPGSLYVYAAAYAVGGVSITTARVTTAFFHAASAIGVYFLTRTVASVGEAVIASLLVAVLCVPAWFMASHHWIATAGGLIAAAVLLAPGWQRSTRLRPAAAGALFGLVLATHQGRGVPLALWLVTAILLDAATAPEERRGRRALVALTWSAIGGATVSLAIVGYAVWRSSFAEVVYATHTFVTQNYRSHHVGTVRWGQAGAFWADSARFTLPAFLQAIPAILALEAACATWAVWRRGWRAQRHRVAVLLLALAAVAGIAYYPDFVHVSFIVPFVGVVLGGMVHRLRTAPIASDRTWARALACMVWAVGFGLLVAKGFGHAEIMWSRLPLRLETAFGQLAVAEPTAVIYDDVRRALDMDPARPPRLYAHATDAWAYLLLPADNPTRFALLRQGYSTPAQFDEVIADLDRDPDAAVLLNLLSIRPDDPVAAYLASWPIPTPIGPRVWAGAPLFLLYRRSVPEP